MSRRARKFVLLGALAACLSLASENSASAPGDSGEEPTALSNPAGSGQEDLFSGAARLERHALIEAVLALNPTIEAARQAWQAALEVAPQATALDDPMASYSLAPDTLGPRQDRAGQILRLSQRLPYPGTLRLRGAVAEAEAEAARQNYERVRLHLATLTSLLFDDYYFVFRALEINDAHIRLLEEFKRVATARYAAGTAAQQDPIQAEVELTRLLHRRIVLQAEQGVVAARLNALLHRPPRAPLPPPPEELPVPAPEELRLEDLERTAVAARPEVRALEAGIRARESAVRLRRLAGYPAFEASASYNSLWEEPDFRWSVGVGINIPLWRDRIRAGVAEAEARLGEAENRLAGLEDEVRSEVRVALERVEEARHAVELYRSRLLPATEDQVQAALSGFKTGRNSFLALIDAERSQRDVELDYQEVLAGLYRSRAELDRALGRLPGHAGGPSAGPPGPPPTPPNSEEGDLP